jgi:predicted ATPase
LDLDDPGALVGGLETLVAAAPFRERRWVLLIRALYASGRQADALAAYQRARTRLIEELGVEPGPELVAAEQAVLAHEAVAARPPRSTLPAPLTSFIGREDELRRLGPLVLEHRLVTLTGSGGVGKSRLAQEVAAEMLGEHPGGVWWVELAPATTPEAVVGLLAAGVGLVLQPGASADDQLVDHLSALGVTLVLLDNCEHVVEIVAGLVHAMLARCPAVRILATSREPLGVPGEQLWRVASLAVPEPSDFESASRLEDYDAAVLFVARAREANVALVVDDRSAPDIVAICARLDGIPLALELAAARSRTMAMERIAAGLADAFGLLRGGPRTALPRHQTLLASILWSHDLLGGVDRAVLRRLSVFPTRFDLAAAQAVAVADGVAASDVATSLDVLVDKGLVELDQAMGRYRMLETLRQFGLERLRSAGEEYATRQRYAGYWADQADAVNRVHYDPAAQAAMLTDVFTTLDWAMEEEADLADRVLEVISPQSYGLGRWPDIHRACDWMLADRERGEHWPGAVASVALGATLIGRHDVLRLIKEAFRLAQERGDARVIHRLSVGPAYAALEVGDLAPARELVAAAMANDDRTPAFQIGTGLVGVLSYLGQLEELVAMCDLTAALAARIPLDAKDSGVGPGQAAADHLAGDLRAALDSLPEQPVSWELITRMWAARGARVAVDVDDVEVVRRMEALVGPADAGGYSIGLLRVIEWAAACLGGDLGAAADAIRSVRGRTAGQRPAEADGLTLLAVTHAAQARWEDAADALEKFDAVVASIDEPAPALCCRAAVVRARIALAGDRPDDAAEQALRALEVATATGLTLLRIDALETLAAISLAEGDRADAARLLGATTADRERRGYLGRLSTPITLSMLRVLEHEQAGAWAEGVAASLDEATAWASAGHSTTGAGVSGG